MPECTQDNILYLHTLLSELYKNPRLPHDGNIDVAKLSLETFIQYCDPIKCVQISGEIAGKYQKAHAVATIKINNLDIENH